MDKLGLSFVNSKTSLSGRPFSISTKLTFLEGTLELRVRSRLIGCSVLRRIFFRYGKVAAQGSDLSAIVKLLAISDISAGY